jgi:hypothetical protein
MAAKNKASLNAFKFGTGAQKPILCRMYTIPDRLCAILETRWPPRTKLLQTRSNLERVLRNPFRVECTLFQTGYAPSWKQDGRQKPNFFKRIRILNRCLETHFVWNVHDSSHVVRHLENKMAAMNQTSSNAFKFKTGAQKPIPCIMYTIPDILSAILETRWLPQNKLFKRV